MVAKHVYSCRFGTFLFNCDRERVAAQVRDRCLSLWDFLHANRAYLTSPFFRPKQLSGLLKFPEAGDIDESLFLPPLPVILRKVSLWQDYHLQHSPKASFSQVPRCGSIRRCWYHPGRHPGG